MFFGERRWFGLFTWLALLLLLVLHSSVTIPTQEVIHLFGMLFAEWCLVRDVKHRDGALLTIRKFGCATSKELLGTIQQNVLKTVLSEGQSSVVAGLALCAACAGPCICVLLLCWSHT